MAGENPTQVQPGPVQPGPSGGQPGQGGTPPEQPDYKLPEKFSTVNDLVKSYTELEKQMGTLGPKAKIADDLAAYGGVDTVLQWARFGATEYEKQKNKPTEPTTPQGDPFDNWEMLSPREQASRIQGMTQKQVMDAVNQLAAQYRTEFQKELGNINSQWDIYRKVMGHVAKHPDVDPEKLMQQMVAISTGKVEDLMGLAYSGLTSEQQVEAKAKAMFEQMKADLEQKQRNDSMGVLTSTTNGNPFQQNGAGPIPKNKAEETSLIMKRLLESGVSPSQF